MYIQFLIDAMIGLSIGTAIGFIVTRHWIKLRRSASRLERIDTLLLKCQEVLDDMRTKTMIDNAILLHIHNGSGDLKAFRRMYSSVVLESPTDDEIRAKDDWQNIEVEPSYRAMLLELREANWMYLDTDTMSPGMLQRLYRKRGIRGSVIFYNYDQTDGGPYYVSCPTRRTIDELLGSSDFSFLELHNQKIKALLRGAGNDSILH